MAGDDGGSAVPPRRAARIAAEALVALAGVALLAVAWRADRAWFDRHVLVPNYYAQPRWLPAAVRWAIAAAAVALLALARPALGRRLARAPLPRPTAGSVGRSALAVLAALVASDLILRVASPRESKRWYPPIHVVVGQPDATMGWRSRPSQTRQLKAAGHPFTYAINAQGDRAPAQQALPDPARPSLVVAGESVAVGFGLNYDETFAALCGRALGLQPVIVAEGAYGMDQAYLRLADALPRVPHPAVVATVFVPVQLGRLLRDDRPRLLLDQRGALRLVPAASGLRAASTLWDVVANRFPYAGDRALDGAVAATAAVLRATARAAEAHGARPLFVVALLGPTRAFDQRAEAPFLRALFADTGLPHVIVDLGPDDVIRGDNHPNAQGARRLADAILAALPALRPPAARGE